MNQAITNMINAIDTGAIKNKSIRAAADMWAAEAHKANKAANMDRVLFCYEKLCKLSK